MNKHKNNIKRLYYPQNFINDFPLIPWSMVSYLNALDMFRDGELSPPKNLLGQLINPISCAGTFIETAPKKFGVFFGQREHKIIYRGQNKDFPTFKPTAKRFNFNKEEDKIEYCINWLQKKTFLDFYQETPYYTRCKNFEISGCMFEPDFEAIAQHYEFISNYIDITTNIQTALFFAYTYTDEKGNCLPIQNFKNYNPTLYVTNMKDLFRASPRDFKIIGFQGLMRPFMQRAMAINVKDNDYLKDKFEVISLPQNASVAQGIYDSMLAGHSIFPQIDLMAQVAREIKQCTNYNVKYWEEYKNSCDIDKQVDLSLLKKKNITFDDKKWVFPDGIISEMNQEIDEGIIPFLENYIDFQTIMRV